MTFEVLFTEDFAEWWETLDADQQSSIDERVKLLEVEGPSLGRPTVDTITSSTLPNLKELRATKGGVLRVLFVCDPIRGAILLLGGDKTGQWGEWYRVAIPRAEALYAEYLTEIRKEGLIP